MADRVVKTVKLACVLFFIFSTNFTYSLAMQVRGMDLFLIGGLFLVLLLVTAHYTLKFIEMIIKGDQEND